LRSFASTVRRHGGAPVSSVVKAQAAIGSVVSKLASFALTTGRGLPTSFLPPATVQQSPRLRFADITDIPTGLAC